MKPIKVSLQILLVAVSASLVRAQAAPQDKSTIAAQHAFLVGLGQAKRGDPSVSDALPWSVAYLYRGANSKVY
jgi:hypothetical protein